MNMNDLSYVRFGDKDGLGQFLFENGVQHRLFSQVLADNNILYPNTPSLMPAQRT